MTRVSLAVYSIDHVVEIIQIALLYAPTREEVLPARRIDRVQSEQLNHRWPACNLLSKWSHNFANRVI